MITQKIITLIIDTEDGTQALKQIQEAAGPGSWRIVSLLDLHDTQGFRHWLPNRLLDTGRRVLVVLEQVGEKPVVLRESHSAAPETMLN